MRISDWSSDVCSSDLGGGLVFRAAALGPILQLDEGQAGALPLAVERETADREDGFDVGFLILEEVVVHDVQRLLSPGQRAARRRSEEHTSELQSLMRISYAVFCLKKKTKQRP